MNQQLGRQGGWVGMIAMVLALVVVAYLAKDAFKKYGMLPTAETIPVKAGSPAERARTQIGGATEVLDVTTAAPVPTSAIDKARGVEGMLNKSAEERLKQH